MRRRQKVTIEQIIDDVLRKHGISGPPPEPTPGTLSMINPYLYREIVKKVAKARDNGLLIEAPHDPEPN